jgi:hypothetical protein
MAWKCRSVSASMAVRSALAAQLDAAAKVIAAHREWCNSILAAVVCDLFMGVFMGFFTELSRQTKWVTDSEDDQMLRKFAAICTGSSVCIMIILSFHALP